MIYRKIVVQEGQNLFDIVLQELGDVSHVFDFLTYNKELNINSRLFAGQNLKVKIQDSDNNIVSKYFSDRKIKISTGDEAGRDFNDDFNNDFA